MIKEYTYQVSEKSVLKRGTPFRCAADSGPVYQSETGEMISMADKGPFVFLWAEYNQDLTLIHALDRDGFHSILHVAGTRTSAIEGLIPRPYVIKNRITKHLHKVKGLRKKLPKIKKGRKKRDRKTTE
jgi:hypothetical protein